MAHKVRFTESVEQGDLDYITELYRNQAKIEFPTIDELKAWVESIDENSDIWTYYIKGSESPIADWNLQCTASKRS